jgi:hypothetical protein
MDPVNYTYIPICISILVQLFIPYFKTLTFEDVYLSPPYYFNTLMFIAKYILLGFVLYESRNLNNDDIFIFAWISVVLNLLWGYYINRDNRYAIIFMFLSMLFGYFIYNEIFLSQLTTNGRTLYLNLMSTYIVWIGYMVVLVFQYEQMFGQKRFKLKSGAKVRNLL